MKLKPIKSIEEYEAYLEWADNLFDKGTKPDTPAGESLHIALLLIKEYEDNHYPVPLLDPIEAIKIKMEEKD